LLAERVEPTEAEPLIVGAARAVGAAVADTTAVGVETAIVEPVEFAAVTLTRSVAFASSVTRT
jgi:hypothetical protein